MALQKNKFVRKIYRDSDINEIQDKIKMLGDNVKFDAVDFMNRRIIFVVISFVLTLIFFDMGYIYAPFVSIAVYYLYGYLRIQRPLKIRTEKLEREALQFFEILTLTLESGRNLESSLEVTCFNVDSEISNEFKKSLFEIKFGKTLIESLSDMKKRIPSEAINNILLNITQTSVFGSGILETMYHQIDFLRDKKILETKEKINKIPNKVSIISVLFIVPLILLLIIGPFIINFLELSDFLQT